jgi:hypothetical protein
MFRDVSNGLIAYRKSHSFSGIAFQAWGAAHLSEVRFKAVSIDYQRLAGASSVRV